MIRMFLSSAFKSLVSRNTAIAGAYREWAFRLPPGPVSKLATSMAQQRLDLGKVLAEVAGDRFLQETEVEFDIDSATLFGDADLATAKLEPKELLKKMAETEMNDHELLAAVAGAILPASSALAEKLAGEAASARKRSIWAQDHLELLEMAY